MEAEWSWAGIPGLKFQMGNSDGTQEGVLVTPWGHGTWGVVTSRPTDVLVASFAQQTHMLLFDAADGFVSTRCSDGEGVQGRAKRR